MIHLLLLAVSIATPSLRDTDEQFVAPGFEEAPRLLVLNGAAPLDSGAWVAWGALTAGPNAARSVLLRSDDGGARWEETMPGEPGSEVNAVAIAGDHLWALTLWTVEGPGELSVSESLDGGKTWRKLATPEKRSHDGQPIAFSMTAKGVGFIRLEYVDAPTTALLVTRDGGRTWKAQRDDGRKSPKPASTRTRSTDAAVIIERSRAGKWESIASLKREHPAPPATAK